MPRKCPEDSLGASPGTSGTSRPDLCVVPGHFVFSKGNWDPNSHAYHMHVQKLFLNLWCKVFGKKFWVRPFKGLCPWAPHFWPVLWNTRLTMLEFLGSLWTSRLTMLEFPGKFAKAGLLHDGNELALCLTDIQHWERQVTQIKLGRKISMQEYVWEMPIQIVCEFRWYMCEKNLTVICPQRGLCR